MDTTFDRTTGVVCAYIVIITLVRYVGVDTTRVRTTGVSSACIIIIAFNQSVDTLASIFITSIGSAEIIIITVHSSIDTSFSRTTSVYRA
jgi:hypothetical protein